MVSKQWLVDYRLNLEIVTLEQRDRVHSSRTKTRDDSWTLSTRCVSRVTDFLSWAVRRERWEASVERRLEPQTSSWAECTGVEGSSYSFSNGVIPALCRDRLLHFYRIHEMPRMFIRGIFTLPDNSESLTVTSVAIKKTFQWLRPYFVLATKFHSPWQGRHPSRASGTFSFVRFRKIDTYKYL